MIIIIGLGNPGAKYTKTRHNLGFRVVDEFFRKNRDRSNFLNFKFKKKFQAEISEGILKSKKIILAKPQTFMNLSGKSVKPLIENWKLEIGNLFVVHDDIDIPLGKIRISKGRGSAGHQGIESIIKELKTKNFVRFRIGIQPKSGKPKNIERFVLEKFNREEGKIVKEIIRKTIEAMGIALKEGIEKAQSKLKN